MSKRLPKLWFVPTYLIKYPDIYPFFAVLIELNFSPVPSPRVLSSEDTSCPTRDLHLHKQIWIYNCWIELRLTAGFIIRAASLILPQLLALTESNLP